VLLCSSRYTERRCRGDAKPLRESRTVREHLGLGAGVNEIMRSSPVFPTALALSNSALAGLKAEPHALLQYQEKACYQNGGKKCYSAIVSSGRARVATRTALPATSASSNSTRPRPHYRGHAPLRGPRRVRCAGRSGCRGDFADRE